MIFLSRKLPIFYSAMLLTGVNLLLRFVGTSFQALVEDYLTETTPFAGGLPREVVAFWVGGS